MHVDFVPLAGVTGDSPAVEAYIVFGFAFGPGGTHKEIHAPASSQSR